MIPRLLPKDATDFEVVGIGALYDATSCIVHEERNGGLSLSLRIPEDGNHATDIAADKLIIADNGHGNPQPFRIYQVDSGTDGILNVEALHLTAGLRWIPFKPFDGHRKDAALAMADLKTSAMITCPFTFESDITSSADQTFCRLTDPVMSIWDKLRGTEGSILQHYGGEYLYNNRTISLLKDRGRDNGVRIAYGKNITALERMEDALDAYDSVIAYYATEGVNTIYSDVVRLSGSTFAEQRALIYDATSDYQSAPTKAQLTAKATSYANANAVTSPTVSIDASYVPLWQFEQYSDIPGLEELEKAELCDTVTVDYAPLGIALKTKVVKTDYNVLLDRYDATQLGTMRGTLSQMLANMRRAIRYGR